LRLEARQFFSSWGDTFFWGARSGTAGRGRRALFDLGSLTGNIENIEADAGNYFPNEVAAPHGPSPVAMFNLQSGGWDNVEGLRIAGDINGLAAKASTSVPMFAGSYNWGTITIVHTGQWEGSVCPFFGDTGTNTSAVVGDVLEANQYGCGLGGRGYQSLLQTPIGIAQTPALNGQAAVFASDGYVPVNAGWTAFFWGLAAKSTGIRGITISVPGTGASITSASWTATGGGCSTEPAGTWTAVNGGGLSGYSITRVGRGCTSTPTIPTSAVTGLRGARVMAQWPSGEIRAAASNTDAPIIGPTSGCVGCSTPTVTIKLKLQGLH
jgi:hypothetical protein